MGERICRTKEPLRDGSGERHCSSPKHFELSGPGLFCPCALVFIVICVLCFYSNIRHEVAGCNDLIILPLPARHCALFTSVASVTGSLRVVVVLSNLLL